MLLATRIHCQRRAQTQTRADTSTFIIRRRPRAGTRYTVRYTRTLPTERILEPGAAVVVPLMQFANRQGRLPAESGRKRALQRLHHAPPPWRGPPCRARGRSGRQQGGAGIGWVEGGWGRLGGVGK